jgi:hypothetical protein
MQRLDASTTLPGGRRIRLRLPHASDREGLRDLLERTGLVADELLLGRLRRFDPRGRVSLVATVLVGRTEVIAGLGTGDRFADHAELIVADESLAAGVGAALGDALRQHALRARRVA